MSSCFNCSFFGYRHLLSVLIFAGLTICYIIRISPGIIILDMVVKHKTGQPSITDHHRRQSDDYDYDRHDLHHQDHLFNWSHVEVNIILGSFFYSYFAMQLPAGWLVQRTGGRWPFALGVSLCGLVCLLIPSMVQSGGFTAFLTLRIFQGFLQGVCYPAAHRLAGQWFPPREYAGLSGFMHSGYIMGTIVALALSGYLIALGGWALPFYASGALALSWLPLWLVYTSETPLTHKWISQEEKAYIRSSINSHVRRSSLPAVANGGLCGGRLGGSVPWRRLLTDHQVILIMACYILDGWANYTLLVCVPQYMDEVLDVSLSENGLLSSLPYIAALGFVYLLTPIDACLTKSGRLSLPVSRKLWTGISAFGKACLLALLAFLSSRDKWGVVALLVLNVMLSSAALLGHNLADLDLAPQYAGFLFSIFNACSSLSAMLAPLLVGFFTNTYPPIAAWRNVFMIASATSCLCGILYILFARPHLLSWLARGNLSTVVNQSNTDNNTESRQGLLAENSAFVDEAEEEEENEVERDSVYSSSPDAYANSIASQIATA